MLIVGLPARNRAMDGDTVVVSVHGAGQWGVLAQDLEEAGLVNSVLLGSPLTPIDASHHVPAVSQQAPTSVAVDEADDDFEDG